MTALTEAQYNSLYDLLKSGPVDYIRSAGPERALDVLTVADANRMTRRLAREVGRTDFRQGNQSVERTRSVRAHMELAGLVLRHMGDQMEADAVRSLMLAFATQLNTGNEAATRMASSALALVVHGTGETASLAARTVRPVSFHDLTHEGRLALLSAPRMYEYAPWVTRARAYVARADQGGLDLGVTMVRHMPARELMQTLRMLEESSWTPMEIAALLSAMATRDMALPIDVSEIEPYLSSPDGGIRVAAIALSGSLRHGAVPAEGTAPERGPTRP